jgi:hypothetical protein
VELKELGIRIDCTLPVRVGRHLARLFLPGRLLFGIRVGDAATLTMLAVKKSMKRSAAASPRSAAIGRHHHRRLRRLDDGERGRLFRFVVRRLGVGHSA